MLNFLNRGNRELEQKMLNQCGQLTYAYAFYKILDSGMRRKNIDSFTQNAFWGIDFKEAIRIFYNTALLHAKVVALRDDYAKMQIDEALKLDIYPLMKKAIEAKDDNNPDLNHLMICHFFHLEWLQKIKGIGQDGFQKIHDESNGEAISMSKRLLSEVAPPWDSFVAKNDEYDYGKYSFYIERYFRLWIAEGFLEEAAPEPKEEKVKPGLESILSEYLKKNNPGGGNPDKAYGEYEDDTPGII